MKTLDAPMQTWPPVQIDPPDDEALAYYAASQQLGRILPPAALQAVFNRIATRLQEDATLQARYETFAKRIAALESGSDAAAQFEGLTGYQLAVPPSLVAHSIASDRPDSSRRPHQLARWSLLGLTVGIGLYMALWLVSTATRPDGYRLAAFGASDLQKQTLRLRAGNAPPDSLSSDTLHRKAVEQLRAAHVSTLGLFGHFDEEHLHDTAALLDHIVFQEEEGSTLQLEALYLLGKTHLVLGDWRAAEAALRDVADRSDWRAAEAVLLLERIGARMD